MHVGVPETQRPLARRPPSAGTNESMQLKRMHLTYTEEVYQTVTDVRETSEAGWFLVEEDGGEELVAVDNTAEYPSCTACDDIRCPHMWAVWQAERGEDVDSRAFVDASILARILPEERGGIND